MDLIGVGWERVDWINLARDKDQWQIYNLLTSFSRRPPFCGVDWLVSSVLIRVLYPKFDASHALFLHAGIFGLTFALVQTAEMLYSFASLCSGPSELRNVFEAGSS
jgi:hypothetical protein